MVEFLMGPFYARTNTLKTWQRSEIIQRAVACSSSGQPLNPFFLVCHKHSQFLAVGLLWGSLSYTLLSWFHTCVDMLFFLKIWLMPLQSPFIISTKLFSFAVISVIFQFWGQILIPKEHCVFQNILTAWLSGFVIIFMILPLLFGRACFFFSFRS